MRFLLLKYLDLDSPAFEWQNFTVLPSPTDSLAILLKYAQRLDAVCYMVSFNVAIQYEIKPNIACS